MCSFVTDLCTRRAECLLLEILSRTLFHQCHNLSIFYSLKYLFNRNVQNPFRQHTSVLFHSFLLLNVNKKQHTLFLFQYNCKSLADLNADILYVQVGSLVAVLLKWRNICKADSHCIKFLICIRASTTAVSLYVTLEVAVNFYFLLENIPLVARRLRLCSLNDATQSRRKAHTFKEEVAWKSSCAGK